MAVRGETESSCSVLSFACIIAPKVLWVTCRLQAPVMCKREDSASE